MIDIRKRRDKLQQKLKQAEGKVMLVKAELKALQHLCSHPNLKEYKTYDYIGDSTLHEECPDCGLHNSWG